MKQQRSFSYARYGYLFSIPFIVVFHGLYRCSGFYGL